MTETQPEITGRKQGRWPKGVSGNVAGRPPGSRNKAALAVEELLNGQAEALTQKLIELALGGNMAALRLCHERLLPPCEDRPVSFTMPKITSAGEAATAMGALLDAVSGGGITPREAVEIARTVETFLGALEAVDFDARLAAIEAARTRQ